MGNVLKGPGRFRKDCNDSRSFQKVRECSGRVQEGPTKWYVPFETVGEALGFCLGAPLGTSSKRCQLGALYAFAACSFHIYPDESAVRRLVTIKRRGSKRRKNRAHRGPARTKEWALVHQEMRTGKEMGTKLANGHQVLASRWKIADNPEKQEGPIKPR